MGREEIYLLDTLIAADGESYRDRHALWFDGKMYFVRRADNDGVYCVEVDIDR